MNRLRQAGLQARPSVRCNVLTAHHLRERLQWCQDRESRFTWFRADGRSRVCGRYNERYAANCVLEHDHFSRGSVMVWAGIHYDGRTVLVRVNGALNAKI